VGEPLTLTTGWALCATPPNACAEPDALAGHDCHWTITALPTTAAAALRAAGTWSLDGAARNFDAEDWWFRLRFTLDDAALASAEVMEFGGLATLAQVWLNGRLLLESANMHRTHGCDVRGLLAADNELLICCRSLDAFLARRRPRPRWRAPMVAHQQLRWARTTLLGRTPGWSPPAAAVGPWRRVRLMTRARHALQAATLHARLDGDDGVLTFTVPAAALTSATPVLRVARGAQHWEMPLATHDARLHAELRIRDVERWWPHTHGEPALYDVAVTDAGAEPHQIGQVGFRALRLDTSGGQFRLSVNDTQVFCRGACWTPPDPVSLDAAPAVYRASIAQARAAGMNMLRVGGTMVYEQAVFYEECDRQGMLVWQDFMFANMDYPEDDPAFAQNIAVETRQFLGQRAHHTCLALLCGNSEVEQQAAMWGAPRSLWSPPLFHRRLKDLVAELAPDLPYWPSSTHGGALPHSPDSGSTSYYGVGAYLRGPEDARRSALRFGSEALAFANVPEPATLRRLGRGTMLRAHQPRWKERSPRDLGAGWDFDDVRDHYLQQLFGVEAMQLRYADHDRFLACSREVSAQLMSTAYAEWRRPDSACGGALIWFLRDLWDGAGWGIVDADGQPKAPWYALRRALQPCALLITDEGNNGPALHLLNERRLQGVHRLDVTLYRDGATPIDHAEQHIDLGTTSALTLPLTGCFEHCHDLGWTFRFGPPETDLIHVTLRDAMGALVAETCWLPLGLRALGRHDLHLQASATRLPEGELELTLQTRRYAHAVAIDAEGYAAEDQYFPLPPGAQRRLRLRPIAARPPQYGQIRVQALNGAAPLDIPVPT
jgi:beta-mannosidase